MKNFYSGFILSVLSVLLCGSTVVQAQVVINEYSASNLSQFQDNYQDYEDWFELYNTTSSTINLGGFYLSDDSLNLQKWPIPASVNITGSGFLRFWCSGRNQVSGLNIHTNFKLTQTKNNPEFILLSDAGGNVIDYVVLSKRTQLGHSRGRTLNGAGAWSIFSNPTPNATNNTATPYASYANKPNADTLGGFYNGPVTVSLTTTEPNSDIRYTLNGDLPTATSTLYSGPITISNTTILKAITISADPEVLKSFLEFHTYFINVSHTVPVVSISGTSLTNLANGSGSLTPIGTWELFNEQQQRVAKTYGEFNRHGQDSWVLSQRSLDFISRDEMGYNHSVEHQIFASTDRDNFQRIILRAAGDDNYPADHRPANMGSAHIRDAYIHNMAIEGDMNLDVRRGRKCVVYLNGAYWGVYDMRDNPDDHDNTKYYYGQDKYNLYFIETWGNTWAEYGGAAALTAWNTFYNYAMSGSNLMTNPTVWQYVTDRYDGTSLVDYVLVNSFTVCSDWLNYNTGWWRGLDSTGSHLRWGYILWDNDATFDHYINYTGVPSTAYNALPCNVEGLSGNSDPKGHILLMNKLRTNPEFNTYYINRQIDLWNTVFSCDNMLTTLDSIITLLSPEMTQHAGRWSGNYTEWYNNAQTLRTFVSNRCNYMSTGFTSCYNVTGPRTLVLNTDPAGAGTIQLNSLNITNFPWTGQYFGNITTSLTATANANYAFTNWTPGTQVFNPGTLASSVQFDLSAPDSIVAHFISSTQLQEIPGADPSITLYPSLVQSQASIEIYLAEKSVVTMKLYSILGDEIMAVGNQGVEMMPGLHKMNLDLSSTSLGSGIYFLDFIAGDYKKTVKFMYSPE